MNHDLPKLSPGYKRPVSWLLLRLIDAYDVLLGPHLGGRCRFAPSCSHYMREAIVIHGIVKGTAMGAKRILRCGPWSKGGYDPVTEHCKCSDSPPKFSLGGQKGGSFLKALPK